MGRSKGVEHVVGKCEKCGRTICSCSDCRKLVEGRFNICRECYGVERKGEVKNG